MVRPAILTILVSMTAALLGSCASYPNTTKIRLETLPQHYSQFDVRLAWETKTAGNQTVVDGVAKNVRYAYMYDLEIWVAVLNNAGKVVARSVSFVIPRQLNQDEAAEFSLKLPVAAPPGTRLRFTYQYRGSDGGDSRGFGEGGTPWMQSFESVVSDR
jgi:hypothetical protein